MLSKEMIQMPKLDLHCHLDGSLPRQYICRTLGRDVSYRELRAKRECESLSEYLTKFQIPLECLQSAENLRRAGREFLLEVKKDNIMYVEVRFAPLLSTNEGLSCREVIEAVLSGLEQARQECGVYYNVIVCAMRHHAPEENLKMIKTSLEFLGNGVCAADLAGDEAAFPMAGFRELFREVKRLGMPFTIHAGECGSVENIVEAAACGASRIGHGIALQKSEEAMQFCKSRGIGIEMCPISNMQTRAVKNKSEYPIRKFLEFGLCVTINTDNRTVSNTTIQKEMEFVQEHYKITDDEFRMFMKNAVEVSFAEDKVKQILWEKIR